jgi:hypothetical protein
MERLGQWQWPGQWLGQWLGQWQWPGQWLGQWPGQWLGLGSIVTTWSKYRFDQRDISDPLEFYHTFHYSCSNQVVVDHPN